MPALVNGVLSLFITRSPSRKAVGETHLGLAQSLATQVQRDALNVALTIADLDDNVKASIRHYLELPPSELQHSATFSEPLLHPVTASFRRISSFRFSSFALQKLVSNLRPVGAGSLPSINQSAKEIETEEAPSFLTDRYYSEPSSVPSADAPGAGNSQQHSANSSPKIAPTRAPIINSPLSNNTDYFSTSEDLHPYSNFAAGHIHPPEDDLPRAICNPPQTPVSPWLLRDSTLHWASVDANDNRIICAPDNKFSVILLKKIGSGAFANVYGGVCYHQRTRYIATKVYNKANLGKRGTVATKAEMDALTRVTRAFTLNPTSGSAFVTKLLWSWQDQKNIHFVMESYAGDLRQLLRSTKLDLPLIKLYTAELALALELIHSISPTGHVALADFGLVKIRSADEPQVLTAHERVGTIAYMAPEILRLEPEQVYGAPADIFSLGLVILEMLIGDGRIFLNHKDPKGPTQQGFRDGGENLSCKNERVKQNTLALSVDDIIPYVKDRDVSVKGLVISMLNLDPEKRPKTSQLKRHQFFKLLDWRKVAARKYIPSYVPTRRPRMKQLEAFTWASEDEQACGPRLNDMYGEFSYEWDREQLRDELHYAHPKDAERIPGL